MSNDKVEATFHGLEDNYSDDYIRQLEATISRVRALTDDPDWQVDAAAFMPTLVRALDGPEGPQP